MAEPDKQGGGADSGPRVHPAGRIAGAPAPEKPATEEPSAKRAVEGDPEAALPESDQASLHEPDAQEADVASEEAESLRFAHRQRKRRKLLHDCERLLLLNFDVLAMPQWPDHFALAKARRRRDLWLLSLGLLAITGLAGMGNLVPAIIGGMAFGLLVLVFMLGTPPIRGFFSRDLSYTELLVKRHQMLREARKHIEHLEGRLGLAWCCRELAEYNEGLRRSRFQGLYRLSQQGRLASSIRNRGHAQLYLMFALEAEKAYSRMRDAYLSDYQAGLDADDVNPVDAMGEAESSDEAVSQPAPEADQTPPPSTA